jgi:hypothetical protein
MISGALDRRPPRHTGRQERTTIIFLLLGGFLIGIGWLVGAARLWASRAWSTPEKVAGTLLVPGGLATMLWLITTFAISTHHQSALHNFVVAAGAILLVLVPAATAIYLARHARAPMPRS